MRGLRVDVHQGRPGRRRRPASCWRPPSHRTTIDTDVLDGWDACLAELTAADPRAADAEVLACSSAGGGLRIAVVGNEELVTAEAGRRVALSSGGRVVHVASGGLDPRRPAAAARQPARRLLLVGGTDGGNAEVLLACTATLARARWRGPVVVAGNVEAQSDVAALLDGSGTPYVLADNVVPQIGVLAPGLRPGRDPRDVPAARDRRQAPLRDARPTSPRWSAAPPPTSC